MSSTHPTCHCGRPAALKQVTDKKKATYGNWFWGCKNLNDCRNPCRFFEWFEGDVQPGRATGDLQKVDGQYKCLTCNQNVVFGDGEHRCRLYGTFDCECGNRWTSGYTWSGETQSCRRCGRHQLPDNCQQLQRTTNRGTSRGPHDSAHCGMCQEFGHPGYLAARPGNPGFVTMQEQQPESHDYYSNYYGSSRTRSRGSSNSCGGYGAYEPAHFGPRYSPD